jgi:hypothetical protein
VFRVSAGIEAIKIPKLLYIYIHICIYNNIIHMYIHIYTYLYICIYVYINNGTYIYIHRYMYTYTHRHIQCEPDKLRPLNIKIASAMDVTAP